MSGVFVAALNWLLLYAAQAAGILATNTEMRSPSVNVGDGLLYLPGLSSATPQYSRRIE